MSMMEVLQQSMRRPVGRLLMVLSVSGLMSYGMVSCKSPHSSATPEVESQQQAVTNPSAGAPAVTYKKCLNRAPATPDAGVTVHCGHVHGTGQVCGQPNGSVTFNTTCPHDVIVTFTNSNGLFVNDPEFVRLPADGGYVTLTIKSSGVTNAHCMCVGSKKISDCSCDQQDSATGSLDVSTTTDPDPDEDKRPRDSQ